MNQPSIWPDRNVLIIDFFATLSFRYETDCRGIGNPGNAETKALASSEKLR